MSVRPQSFSDLNEIWCLGRDWWVLPNPRSRSRRYESCKNGRFQILPPPVFM